MHSEQTLASSDVKGVAQTLQEGPEYFFIPDQQAEQNGAVPKASVSSLHEGHSEG